VTTSETILVVDDEAFLRMNMRAFLEDLGYEVLEASGGAEALERCRRRRPDLVLLDISMPGMDGYEVCRRLSEDPCTAGIPVLFLSALQSTGDKVRAFTYGGVDYVTKPFQFEEVEARVRTHLELARQRRELKEQYGTLKHLEDLRDAFTHMVAHDMRGPLTGIIASLELSLETLGQGGTTGVGRKLELALGSAGLLNDMISEMLELSRMESLMMPLEPALIDLAAAAAAAVESQRPAAGRQRLTVKTPGPMLAWCDPSIVNRVLVNLIGNAMKYIAPDGTVEVGIALDGPMARVTVTDNGPGLSEQQQANVFEKFWQVPGSGRNRGLGLGLAFCKSAIAAHQGEIGVDSGLGRGCTFWFTLPVRPKGYLL